MARNSSTDGFQLKDNKNRTEKTYLLKEFKDPHSSEEGIQQTSLSSVSPPGSVTVTNCEMYLGYSFSLVAGLCFTISGVSLKLATEASSWQMLLIRSILQMLVMLLISLWTKSSLLGSRDIAIMIRMVIQSIVGGLLLLTVFETYTRLPIGDSTAILFSAPAFTMLLSICLLRDHCGIYRTVVCSLLLLGIVIISRPPSLFPPIVSPSSNGSRKINVKVEHVSMLSQKTLGIILGVSSSILSAFLTIVIKKINHVVHYSVLCFWFAAGCLVTSLVLMLSIDSKSSICTWNSHTWLLCLLQSFLGVLGSILLMKALSWMSPTKTMVVRSIQVIFSYTIQVWAFGTVPHLMDVAGAALIVTAALGIGLEDWLLAHPTIWRLV